MSCGRSPGRFGRLTAASPDRCGRCSRPLGGRLTPRPPRAAHLRRSRHTRSTRGEGCTIFLCAEHRSDTGHAPDLGRRARRAGAPPRAGRRRSSGSLAPPGRESVRYASAPPGRTRPGGVDGSCVSRWTSAAPRPTCWSRRGAASAETRPRSARAARPTRGTRTACRF